MSQVADQASTVPAPRPTTWDPAGARFGPHRIAAAVAMIAFAAAMAAVGGFARVLAVLVVVDVAVMSLPWRVPRAGRSMASIWLENLCYLVMPVGTLLAAIVTAPSWLGHAGAWWWYPVALVAGAALVAAGGLDVRALLSGEIAFIAGPRPKGHAASHVLGALVGPPGEEMGFRATVLYPVGVSAVVAPVLGALAFVARHHLAPQVGGRLDVRALRAQLLAAAVLVVLTVLSRSIYPALVAHLVNNLPQAVLEIQRGWGGEGE